MQNRHHIDKNRYRKSLALCFFALFLNLETLDFETLAASFGKGYLTPLSESQIQKILNPRLLPDPGNEKILSKAAPGTLGSSLRDLILYFSCYPDAGNLAQLKNLGVEILTDSWTPPINGHPLGYLLARCPESKFPDLLNLNYILSVDDAEEESFAQSNLAAVSTGAGILWKQGLTGKAVPVAILDSGLDAVPRNPDLPLNFKKMDYSNYANPDTTVQNTATGHGTHVTGLLFSQGVLSENNSGNGGGAFRGMAYGADLIFLKIGRDGSGGASNASIITALNAAINIYRAKVINLSYGAWDTYHDGSSAQDQKADWCYSQGAMFFAAAGNFAADRRHYSGETGAESCSELIRINVTGAQSGTILAFNLIWQDGSAPKNLMLNYYDKDLNPISPTRYPITRSLRNTASSISYLPSVPSGSSVYYLRVYNPAGSSQKYHIYEYAGQGKASFDSPDPNFTIASPSTADHAFCVGAYSVRDGWTNASGNSISSCPQVAGNICSFSSMGPRIDGLQKPEALAPGGSIISMRDRDIFKNTDQYCIDDDGINGGASDYYLMSGTSMASPVAAGAAALIKSAYPDAEPQEIYNALKSSLMPIPNQTTGSINLESALWDTNLQNKYGDPKISGALPVELLSFKTEALPQEINIEFKTASELNSAYFEIKRTVLSANRKDSIENERTIAKIPGSGNSNSIKSYSFTDKELGIKGIYLYSLFQTDFNGNSLRIAMAEAGPVKSGVCSLSPCYPNPFSNSTAAILSIPEASDIRISIFNSIGCLIRSGRERFEKGSAKINISSNGLASGCYFLVVEGKDFRFNRKIMLLK